MKTNDPSLRFLLVAAMLFAGPLPSGGAAPQPVRPSAPTTQALPSVADLVDRVEAAVVNIEVVGRRQTEIDPQLREGLERFFGELPEELEPRVRRGAGSGVLIDAEGRILTNSHVVEGATSIRVHLVDGRALPATVLGTDPLTDLAVLKLEAPPKDLAFAVLGDSSEIRVGDPVVAIGNPFGLESSVSLGVLSGRSRHIGAGPYDDFLQTDAAINPGNSGGPLFDAKGEVIGINTAIVGVGTGVGFAIPSNLAKQIIEPLSRGHEIRRGWLGVSVQDLTPELAEALGVKEGEGAAVADVEAGSPGAAAGLRASDVILSVNDIRVESARDLTRIIGFTAPNTRVTLRILRNRKTVEVPVRLGERPDLERIRPTRGEDRPGGRSDTGAIGLKLQDARRGAGIPGGAIVASVEPGSPADEAGLQEGMVIFEADGRPVRSAEDLAKRLARAKPGVVVLLRAQIEGRRLLAPLRVPEER